MVQGSVLGRRAADRKARAVKQLGNEIGDDDVFNVDSRAVGDSAHLFKESLGDVLALLGNDPLDHAPGIEQLHTLDFDADVLGLHLEEETDVFADVVTQEGTLLVAHLVGFALDVQYAVAVDLVQKSGAAARERLGLGLRCRNRAEHDQPRSRSVATRFAPSDPALSDLLHNPVDSETDEQHPDDGQGVPTISKPAVRAFQSGRR